MDEFSEPSSFSSVEPADSPSKSRSLAWQSLECGRSELEPGEYKTMFETMCKDYEQLRVRADREKLSENEFMPRLGSLSTCFLVNPNLFTEVHEIWLEDFNRALMHRVDPFQKALELLRLHLNPIVPEDFEKRKKLQREILGPLKSPQVVFGATPFELPPSPKVEKTSLKKQQAAAEASCKVTLDASNSKKASSPRSRSQWEPVGSPRKLDNSDGLTKLGSAPPTPRKLSSPRWEVPNGSPRKVESKSPRSERPTRSFFGFRKPSTQEDDFKKAT